MSTTTTVTPLTEAEAIAQVQKWIDAGLPGGAVWAKCNQVTVMLSHRDEVDLWMQAMGISAVLNGLTYGCPDDKPRPVALPGWDLDVWCSATRPGRPAFRIEVL